jgi:RNA polymerase sigma-70 factor, ECF subfamily
MAPIPDDIKQAMGTESCCPDMAPSQHQGAGETAGAGGPGDAVGGATDAPPRQVALAPGEFSAQLEPLRRSLWVIAAAVVGSAGGGREEAEDIVQEAAVIALAKLNEFEPSTSFAAWMGQIVRNLARNHARKQQRRRTINADSAVLDRVGIGVGGHGSADPPVSQWVQFDSRVLQALDELDELARSCLLLRTIRELPYKEISSLLGIPEGTAMSHVHRARQALRARLADDSRLGVGRVKP